MAATPPVRKRKTTDSLVAQAAATSAILLEGRFTFGSIPLTAGIPYVAAMIGLFGIAEVLMQVFRLPRPIRPLHRDRKVLLDYFTRHEGAVRGIWTTVSWKRVPSRISTTCVALLKSFWSALAT